jgi:hypothetical protein
VGLFPSLGVSKMAIAHPPRAVMASVRLFARDLGRRPPEGQVHANRPSQKGHRWRRFKAVLTIFVARQGAKVSHLWMTPAPDLDSLSHEDMKSLILTLLARVAELEAQLGKPAKNSSNSSVPPSKEFKANARRPRSSPC